MSQIQIKLNMEDRLYLIHFGTGFTCLGFDVCLEKAKFLASELNMPEPVWYEEPEEIRVLYDYYSELCEMARIRHQNTGWKSRCWLTPQLIGLEGKRVEVVDCYGETRRFKVGRSTGHCPCHLELKSSKSTGGCAVSGTPFKSVTVL